MSFEETQHINLKQLKGETNMNKPNAILIDPKTQTIQIIPMNNVKDLEEMKKWIDCEMVELAITFDDVKVDMYCDEEGWLRNRDIYGFSFDGVLIPSKALVLGYTDEGEQAPLNEVKITYMLNLLFKGITWRGELTEDDMPPIELIHFN